ncbi:MAG: glycosyltransferase [Muribaculaceae bacterium]|nr:glycosyltransferase [Muribaculaceae bacterium]
MVVDEPIRILHEVAGLGNGGVETFLMNVYRNIDRSKIQFDFILSHDWNINLYEDEIKSLGGKIYYLPEGYKQFYSFYRFLKNHPEYKVVHSHRGAFGSFYLFTSWFAGVGNRIAHAHTSSAVRKSKARWVRFLRPFLNIVSTKRFSCGQEAGLWMYGKSNFEVLNNSIDISSFRHFDKRDEIRDMLGVETDELLFGHVGRFAEEKNHVFIIDVFKAIHDNNNKTKLLLIGDGHLRPFIENKVRLLGLNDAVIFLRNRDDVNLLLTAIDMVLFPSLFEGLSFAMLEMQASSLRILASDSIPKEVNITGEVYFKSLEDSPNDWAETALELSNYSKNDVDIDSMYKKGFDVRNNVKRLENYYLSCVNNE